MQPFTKLDAIAAPLPLINVDTDMIIPKQFLKTIKRTGLGKNLFDEMRYTESGEEIADFVLNTEPFRASEILVSGDNFGCGSSREHAPWALLDYGIRCIIAPSFADIFYNNCFKNGILPIVLPKEEVEQLTEYCSSEANPVLSVDLPNQQVKLAGSNIAFSFDVDEFRKHCLLEGLDDIAMTLESESDITSFEGSHRNTCPWLF